jgi:hypothetical protein
VAKKPRKSLKSLHKRIFERHPHAPKNVKVETSPQLGEGELSSCDEKENEVKSEEKKDENNVTKEEETKCDEHSGDSSESDNEASLLAKLRVMQVNKKDD